MTPTDLQLYRGKLRKLGTKLCGEVAELRSESLHELHDEDDGESASAIHPTDQPNHKVEEELTRTLLDNEEEILAKVGEALARIERGTYGRCEECGQAIPRDRLRAVPYTRCCVTCAHRHAAEVEA